MMTIPRATMRLQLHREFTFADVAGLAPYLAALGVSHLYASPILTARTGSMHGYDVTDPTRVNPELGGESGLRRLVAALRTAGIGLIVDIVPNHMAAGGLENPWWGDVLRHGRASRYAKFFDIDWDSADPVLRGKVLAPFLGEPYGNALREARIVLDYDRNNPRFRYYTTHFPIRPEDHAEIAAATPDAFDPSTEAGRSRLHRLLERQHYRLAWWRSANDTINWRRFFDINGLAAVRVEDETVFDATHETLLRLYREGLIDGFRIDHADGLADPAAYCRRLRTRLDELAGQRPPDAPHGLAWLVVEKILGPGERLPDDWEVHGTSGYDFMDEVSALLHDASGEFALRQLWQTVSGRTSDFSAEDVLARSDVLDRAFTAQLDVAVTSLHHIALARLETRDTTQAAIRRALVALLGRFPVYRSYGVGQPSSVLAAAVANAMADVPAVHRATLALLERWLGEEATPEAALRFQQLSAPLAAKAVEDTAYYRYGVLLSRNEVGANARRFSATAAEFHAACQARRERFPHAMLATATHDHKRGEDLRVRLAVLSERAQEWERIVRRWVALNAPHRRRGARAMPSPGDEVMLYQIIVAAWPTELELGDAPGVQHFTDRLADYQLKAMREAKLATDWIVPDLEYEDAAKSFLYAIMADTDGFAAEAWRVAKRIGPAGAVNGLSQTLLKLTTPGVPDLYQGAEFWDQSLVDPDNRRAVDFTQRIDALAGDQSPLGLAAHWQDGRVKQAVIRRALALRRAVPELFARGTYQPLGVTGPEARHVVAFARSLGGTHCLVAVPRLVSNLLEPPSARSRSPATQPDAADEGRAGAIPSGELAERTQRPITIPEDRWHNTTLHVPDALVGHELRDCLSGIRVGPLGHEISVAMIMTRFPVALLATE
jgi:malto-oligosyltrehalose synthase